MLSQRTNGPTPLPAAPAVRSLILVAGSGRSGTSLFAGILQRLGYAVPQPEVPADDTNPRGFGESQWVVDFHARLLKQARVQVSDARPGAWALTGRAGLDEAVAAELRGWLELRFGESEHLVIKDPRVSWFLPLWRRCAADLGAGARCVTLLRHPAAVVDSKQRWYGGWQGEVSRAAGWVNQTLFTERATREAPRAFVRYDDLLDDWPRAIGRVDEALDLVLLQQTSPASMRRVHEFVDRGLSRSRGDWEHLALPEPLRTQAEEVWLLVSRLADEAEGDREAVCERLDELRGAYADLYAEAEAVAHSSISAARPRPLAPAGPPGSPAAAWLIRRVPVRYKRRVPRGWRSRVNRALSQA